MLPTVFVFASLGPKAWLLAGFFVCFGGQSRGGHTTGPVSAAAYLHFVIG